MTREELIAFEQDIAECFNLGEIRSPVHLAGGNEDALIDIFQDIGPEDWVCGAWRTHFHALLKGVPPARLKADILAGHSITLCYPEYRIITSAIVGGILPIALGLAWSIKRAGGSGKVWCFLGDMTAMTGMCWECANYSKRHLLPLHWVLENNGISVCTPTEEAWGTDRGYSEISGYDYKLPWPHAGAGKRVQF